jgi:hypothetical protein
MTFDETAVQKADILVKHAVSTFSTVPSRWRKHIPQKCWYLSAKMHGATSVSNVQPSDRFCSNFQCLCLSAFDSDRLCLSHSGEYAALSRQTYTEMSRVFNRISSIECFKINSKLYDFHYKFISADNAIRHCVTRLKHKHLHWNVIMARLMQHMPRIYVNVSRIHPVHVTFLSYYFGSTIGNCFTSAWQTVKKYTSYTADRYFQQKH